jgi:hypothetical protein
MMKKAVFGTALFTVALAILFVGGLQADKGFEHDGDFRFFPGNLVVSRSVYHNDPDNVTVGTVLPPNCASTTGGCAAATGTTNNGTYPQVWNNSLYDASFGITSKIYLDQLTPFGWYLDTLEVPSNPNRSHLVTSFPSKSELALNLSTDREYLTFMGYVAPIDLLDVSNSNTPGAADPTNPVGEAFYRAVAQVDEQGKFAFTEINAYSGNNGRAAILSNRRGANFIYTAGNAGNGANPQPVGIVLGAGAQIMTPPTRPEKDQTPGVPVPVASFNINQLAGNGQTDKIGKDDNFRGMTIFHNVLYYTKGSGSNGVNTVYFVDTTGTACPTVTANSINTAGGVGVPSPKVSLPTSGISYDPATLETAGLDSNMCILRGFNTVLAKSSTNSFPFGLWFADAHTLYVADEGDGYAGGLDLDTHAAAQTTAGLQKWVFNSAMQTWQLAYILQRGLKLGVPYTVPGYPTGLNPATAIPAGKGVTVPAPDGLPWSPATDGLRNITGHVDWDGNVTIWGITSTVSGDGDQGADPNRLVAITDKLTNTDPAVAAAEQFHTLRTAQFGEVLRGVSLTPGTPDHDRESDQRDDHAGR